MTPGYGRPEQRRRRARRGPHAHSGGGLKVHVLVIPRGLYGVPRIPIAGVFERHQVAALRLAGMQVGVLSAGVITARHLGRRFPHPPEDVVDGVVVYRVPRRTYLPARWEDPLAGARRSYRRLKPALEHYLRRHGRPEIIHAHNLASGGLVARHVYEDFGIPYVITEHTSTFAGDPQAVQHAVSAISPAAETALRIIAVGERLAANLRFGLHPNVAGRVIVVPNVVDPMLLCEPIPQQTFPLTVGALGGLIPRKNYELLVQAFANAGLPRDARLMIGGSGPQGAQLVALAERLRIQDRVHLLGQLDRTGVIRLLGQAAIFAHPSNSESFGVVLVEALSLGVPVVATASGGPEDIITPDVGRLVPVQDVARFTHALTEVYEQRADFCPVKIREFCRARFGPEVFATKMLAIYREALL